MNELKSEDVMKAIEYCLNTKEYPKCSKCDYITGCKPQLLKLALALLREKDARIKELEEAQGAEFTCFVGEPHKVDRCPYVDALADKDAEIERLTAQIEHCDACDRIGLTHTEHMYCIKQAKSEAITEFAERLKSEVNGGQFASYKGLEIRNVIDQIAKEMKEGKR